MTNNIMLITYNQIPYYTKEQITLEFLKRFLNKVEPALTVYIYKDENSKWLSVQGQIWAEQYYGFPITPCYEDSLNWQTISEVIC